MLCRSALIFGLVKSLCNALYGKTVSATEQIDPGKFCNLSANTILNCKPVWSSVWFFFSGFVFCCLFGGVGLEWLLVFVFCFFAGAGVIPQSKSNLKKLYGTCILKHVSRLPHSSFQVKVHNISF